MEGGNPVNSSFDMSGKAIGITGGGGFLGSAMAHQLVQAGATVLIMGRTRSTLEAVRDGMGAAGERVVVSVGDVLKDTDIQQAVGRLHDEAGRVDGWVNNANTSGGGQFLTGTRESFESAARGLADTFMATQIVANAMIAQGGGGAIVNVASMYGVVSPDPRAYEALPDHHNPPMYGAVKAGVLQFTRYAAVHLAEHGIRVNCVTPGAFPKARVREHREFARALESRIPLGRLGHPDELSGAVHYLLSDAASFTTGTAITVDGGWTAW